MSQKLLDVDSRLLDPAEIEKCLNCERPKCNNCLADVYTGKKTQRVILEADKLAEWYNEGRTIRWIADHMGLHNDTVRKRVKEYGLCFTEPRPRLSYAFFLALPETQRKYLTWKGERLA